MEIEAEEVKKGLEGHVEFRLDAEWNRELLKEWKAQTETWEERDCAGVEWAHK